MFVVIFDIDPASRAGLTGRVQLASKQAEVSRADVIVADHQSISSINPADVLCCFIGSGCYSELEDAIERVRSCFPKIPIAMVLENEVYAAEAVSIRRSFGVKVMPLGDLAQIAGFLIDSESQSLKEKGTQGTGIFAIAQLKGGVGATSVTAALAACWARHGLTVAAIDLDDVNPQLTEWARVGSTQRSALAQFLKRGEVPASRLNEIVSPVEGYDGRLVVVGQPEQYRDGFHYKADVLEGAPSSSHFLPSLVRVLRSEFDVVVIDLGRSWGVSTFSVFPICQQVLLVTDDDGMSVRRTLDGFQRLLLESDDPDEFNLTHWSVLLNAHSGKLISPKDLAAEIQDMELLPSDSTLYTIPFTEKGRQWGAPGQSLFELADEETRLTITRIAHSLMPFRYVEQAANAVNRLVKKFKGILGSSSAQI